MGEGSRACGAENCVDLVALVACVEFVSVMDGCGSYGGGRMYCDGGFAASVVGRVFVAFVACQVLSSKQRGKRAHRLVTGPRRFGVFLVLTMDPPTHPLMTTMTTDLLNNKKVGVVIDSHRSL